MPVARRQSHHLEPTDNTMQTRVQPDATSPCNRGRGAARGPLKKHLLYTIGIILLVSAFELTAATPPTLSTYVHYNPNTTVQSRCEDVELVERLICVIPSEISTDPELDDLPHPDIKNAFISQRGHDFLRDLWIFNANPFHAA